LPHESSISRGDYLTLFSGLSDDASASITTEISLSASASPQYGKKDDHFTFREMYGDVNHILDGHPEASNLQYHTTAPSGEVTEDWNIEPGNELITPRTRTAMVDHDQVVETIRERAAILSDNWADKDYVAPSLARRLRDFEFAQKKRRRKFGHPKAWGILGLYDFLSAVREDVEWAEDAAFRRANCIP